MNPIVVIAPWLGVAFALLAQTCYEYLRRKRKKNREQIT